MEKPDLRRLDAAPRTLAAGFLIALGLAYGVALLFVFVQSGMTPKGIAVQYRGSPAGPPASDPASADLADEGASEEAREDESVPALGEEWKSRSAGMRFPKSLKDMILTTHLHLLSISAILFLVGGIFAFSSFPEKAKAPVIASGFAALILTYACMWAVRFAGGAFSPGVFLFGLAQALAMATQILWSLRDLMLRRA